MVSLCMFDANKAVLGHCGACGRHGDESQTETIRQREGLKDGVDHAMIRSSGCMPDVNNVSPNMAVSNTSLSEWTVLAK